MFHVEHLARPAHFSDFLPRNRPPRTARGLKINSSPILGLRGAVSDIPTLESAKSAKFRMGQPRYIRPFPGFCGTFPGSFR
jgi:hypothetical protein